MKQTTVVSLAVLVMAGLATNSSVYAASNAEGHEDRDAHFAEVDTNKDGAISHDEMMARVQSKFDEFDTNRDGFLELAELPTVMPVPEHMKQRVEKRRAKMQKHMLEHKGEMPEKMQKHMAKKMGERHQPTRMRFIVKRDTDGDERVSFEEFYQKPVKHFKKLDTNGDGSVSREEFNDMTKHKGKKHHKGKRRHGG